MNNVEILESYFSFFLWILFTGSDDFFFASDIQIGECMAQKFIFKHKDNAIHLDAVAKIKGIAAAENY